MDEKGDLRISPGAVAGWRSRQLLVESAFLILLVAAGFLVRLWPMSRAHFCLREFPSLVLYRYHDSVDGEKFP